MINLNINNIKFRAKIKDLDELALVIDMDMGYQTGELLELSVKGKQSEHGEHCMSAPGDPYGCYLYDVKYIEHLMMSTGRKDINGVEIFEGDFLKSDNVSGIYMVINNFNNNLSLISLDGGYADVILMNDAEVVGNCWEDWDSLSESEKERIKDRRK